MACANSGKNEEPKAISQMVRKICEDLDAKAEKISREMREEVEESSRDLENYILKAMEAFYNPDSATSKNVKVPKTPVKKPLSPIFKTNPRRRSSLKKAPAYRKVIEAAKVNSGGSSSAETTKLRLSTSSEGSPTPSDAITPPRRSTRQSTRLTNVDLNKSASKIAFKVPLHTYTTQKKSSRLSSRKNKQAADPVSSEGENVDVAKENKPDIEQPKTSRQSVSRKRITKNSSNLDSNSVAEERSASIVPPPSNRSSRSKSSTSSIRDSSRDVSSKSFIQEEESSTSTRRSSRARTSKSKVEDVPVAKRTSSRLGNVQEEAEVAEFVTKTVTKKSSRVTKVITEPVPEKASQKRVNPGNQDDIDTKSPKKLKSMESSSDSNNEDGTKPTRSSPRLSSRLLKPNELENEDDHDKLSVTQKTSKKSETSEPVAKQSSPKRPSSSKSSVTDQEEPSVRTKKSKDSLTSSGIVEDQSKVKTKSLSMTVEAPIETIEPETTSVIRRSSRFASKIMTEDEPERRVSSTNKPVLQLPECQVNLTIMADEKYKRVDNNKMKLLQPTPLNPRTDLRSKMLPTISKSVSPKTPRQLFSPFVKQSVKSKAAIFENLQQTPAQNQIKKLIPQTIIIKPRTDSSVVDETENASPDLRSGRKMVNKAKKSGPVLVVPKYNRMAASLRRRSSVRLSISAVKKQMETSISKTVHEQDEEKAVEGDNDDSDEYESASSGEEDEVILKKPVQKHRLLPSAVILAKTSKKKSLQPKEVKKTSIQRTSNSKATYPGSENRNMTFGRIGAITPTSLATTSTGGGMKKVLSAGRIGSVQKIASAFGKSTPTASVVPKKHDAWLQNEYEKRKEKEAAALLKKEKLIQEKKEMSKKKNQEKQKKVLEKRQEMFKAHQERKRTIELRQEQHAQRKLEMEQKRKEELEKRRKDELIVKQKIQAMKAAQLEEQQRLLDEESKSAIACAPQSPTKPKNVSATGKPIPKAVAAAANQTFNADTSEVGVYDITPHHSEVPPQKLTNPENYDINDLKSDDETDDESAPKKQIPSWAKGIKLHLLVRKQVRSNIDVEEIFPSSDVMRDFNLADVFPIVRRRFYNRTSSAVWHVQPHTDSPAKDDGHPSADDGTSGQ